MGVRTMPNQRDGHHAEFAQASNPTAGTGGTFFVARKHRGGIETRGQPCASFGHRLPSPDHPMDDGVFARWHWDGTRLLAENDRYGFHPLFQATLPGGGVALSPSLVTLVEQGAPTELDIEALSVFFRLGSFVGDDTPFSAIKALPPNADFEWRDGHTRCEAGFPPCPASTTGSRDDAIDQFIQLFATAMARRQPPSSRFAVPISGGRDSRHILLELHRTGFCPEVCVSANDNPPDPNRDPVVAAELCKALGLQHEVINQRLSIAQAELRKNIETNFCATAHGWYLALADFLNGQFDCTYDGIAGDVFTQSLYLNKDLADLVRSGNVDSISSHLLNRYGASQASLDHLLRKGALQETLDPQVAIRRISRDFVKHLDMPNPIASFFFWNRTRRQTALAPYALLKGIPHVYAPFLDHDVFDFFNTLPTNMVMDRKFHTDAIARAYPDFAHIPYADNKADARTNDRAVRARFMSELNRMFLFRHPSTLMRNMAPRMKMLVGALSHGHGNQWVSPLILYLCQIESAAAQSHSRTGPDAQ